jgi:hypothetical protein
MRATPIYEAILEDAEIRKHIHQKHLATFESFYEGNFNSKYFVFLLFVIL